MVPIMKRTSIGSVLLCMASVTMASWQAAVNAQQPAKPKVDVGSLAKEIMALKFEGDGMQLAMWLPFDFFLAANMDGQTSRSDVEKELLFLKPYHTVMVQSSFDAPNSATVYESAQQVRGRAVLRLEGGEEIKPLDQVPPMVVQTLEVMRKTLAASQGESGANMHILVFPATHDSKPLLDTSKKDKLILVLKSDAHFKETVFTWHTPFDAMSPVPPCPKCKEIVSAKWSYCPWCGNQLDPTRQKSGSGQTKP